MKRSLVQISISLNPDLLERINRDIHAKNRSARIRNCVEKGYENLRVK
jgi:metal-responsive CopG/Arc/MetJ family transcriptional regulator